MVKQRLIFRTTALYLPSLNLSCFEGLGVQALMQLTNFTFFLSKQKSFYFWKNNFRNSLFSLILVFLMMYFCAFWAYL